MSLMLYFNKKKKPRRSDMYSENKIWIAQSDKNIYMLPKMANRHGLIAGATGTGKTITMKVMAESFSDMGVPVFFSDVKGDLTGMCVPGTDSADMRERIDSFGITNWTYKSYPTRFWDIFGEQGHPVRITISGLGPALLGRLLGLTEVQTGVLNIVFKIADEHGLLLLDLKDLRAMLQFVGDNRKEFTTLYGNVSAATVGAIQRSLLAFEEENGECLFGEPELDIADWIRTDADGRGYINVLASSRLIQSPMIYATFLLWMLSDLYEKLPEVGDLEKPRFVFFFDEAHLLFDHISRTLEQKIVQTVKLIRSKGVGVYFVTQSPSDVPDAVLSQLNNRIQHGLRAYTPSEQKAVRAAAEAFRENPEFDTKEALMNIGTGEAIISVLDEFGAPTVVEKARVLPPQSFMGAADSFAVQSVINSSEFDLKYREPVDRESAYEIILKANEELQAQQEAEEARKQEEKEAAAAAKEAEKAEREAAKEAARAEKEAAREAARAEKEAAKEAARAEKEAAKAAEAKKKVARQAATNAASSVAGSLTTNIVNSVTGSGKTASVETIAKRAASNALSSVMRTGAKSFIRGLFGVKK